MPYQYFRTTGYSLACLALIFSELSYSQTRAWNKCTRQYGDLSCEAYVASEQAYGVLKPNNGEIPVGSQAQGEHVTIRSPFEDPQNPGWLLTEAVVNGVVTPAWLRASDVARNFEFNRVSGCWPVEMIEWTVHGEGDSPSGTYRVKMDVAGNMSLEAKKIGASNSNYRRISGEYQIYYAKTLFRLADVSVEGRDGWLVGNFVLDTNKEAVKVRGLGEDNKSISSRMQPIQILEERGCKSGPIVDAQKSLSPKPKRK
jgi:hypothetical protein